MGFTGHAPYSGWVSDISQGFPLGGAEGRWGQDQFHFVSFYLKKSILLVLEHPGKFGGRIEIPLLTFFIEQRLLHSPLYLHWGRGRTVFRHSNFLQGSDLESRLD